MMKNVTGLDVARGLTGSWGTLAVMTEVTFKVRAAAADHATLAFVGLPDDSAIEALMRRDGHAVRGLGRRAYAAELAARIRTPKLKGLEPVGDRHCGSRSSRPRSTSASEKLKAAAQGLRRRRSSSNSESRSASGARSGRLRDALHRPSTSLWRISTPPDQGAEVVVSIRKFDGCDAGLRLVGRLDLARGARRRRCRRSRYRAAPSPNSAAMPL